MKVDLKRTKRLLLTIALSLYIIMNTLIKTTKTPLIELKFRTNYDGK